MTKKCIYPGSFDPITYGHIDIVKRALRVFDKVHIAVFVNVDKNPLFSVSERIALIEEVFYDEPNVIVDSFGGLVSHYCQQKEINTIIRGLRAVSDFDYEFQMSLTNRKLNDTIDTVFFMTDEKYSYLSSSLVRQLASFNSEVEHFVPKVVEEAMKEKL